MGDETGVLQCQGAGEEGGGGGGQGGGELNVPHPRDPGVLPAKQREPAIQVGCLMYMYMYIHICVHKPHASLYG